MNLTNHYHLKDHLGSNRVTKVGVGEGGSVLQRMNYYPFGEISEQTDNTSNAMPWKFGGKELDVMHGLDLYDFHARPYDARLGQFTMMDPKAEDYYEVSPYTYCHDDPVNRVDPDGKDDYFSTSGQYIKTVGTGADIYIGKTNFRDLNLMSDRNMKVAARVIGHYARQVGIKYNMNGGTGKVGISNEYRKDNDIAAFTTRNGDIFMNIDTSKEYELALPILIGKTINSSLLEKGAIKDFQNLLLSRYCKSYKEAALKLIKPSGNKNVDIPLYILSKFLIKFYTGEGGFYRDLNRDLTNDKFDDYHPFIFLLYDSLNKGFIKSYKGSLYRGDKINKNEFNKIISNKNKNKNEKLFYFSKKFLSFSKNKQSALNFLSESKEDNITIFYILKECKNTKYFVTNIDIDIEKLTFFKNEKEVLILPLTCFEIVKIGKE